MLGEPRTGGEEQQLAGAVQAKPEGGRSRRLYEWRADGEQVRRDDKPREKRRWTRRPVLGGFT